MTTFGDATGDDNVGSLKEIYELRTDAAGSTVINSAEFTIGDKLVFNDAVILGTSGTGKAETTLNNAAGFTIFNETLDAATPGVQGLIITSASQIRFFENVGGISPLASLAVDSTFNFETTFACASVTTTGNQNYMKDVILGSSGATTFTGSFIFFHKKLDASTGAQSLSIDLPMNGQLLFGESVGSSTALDSIITTVEGTTRFSGNPMNAPTSVTTTGSQTYNNEAITYGDVTFNSTASGNLSFPGGINSGFMPGQNFTFNTAGTTELYSVGADVPTGGITTDAPGTTTFNDFFVNFGGQNSFYDPVVLHQSVTFIHTGTGFLGFESTIDSDGTPRDLFFSVPPTASVFLAGSIGANSPLNFISATATIYFETPTLSTLGEQSYHGPMFFDGPSALVSQDSQIFLNGNINVDEGVHVTVNTGPGAGDIILPGNIFGTEGGILETLTLRAGQGSVSVTGVVAPTILVIIEQRPVITRQPTGGTFPAGADVTLSVSAIGTAPFSYEWRKGGAALGGETNPTLTLSDVQMSDSGAYSVVVSNDAGDATSADATITVLTPPEITVQPMSQSVAFEDDVTLNVTATGSPTLRYQWRFNGVNLSGATDSSLMVGGVQAADLGRYSVIVQNGVGAVTSAQAELTVSLPSLGVAKTPDAAPTQTDASGTKSAPIPDSGELLPSLAGARFRRRHVRHPGQRLRHTHDHLRRRHRGQPAAPRVRRRLRRLSYQRSDLQRHGRNDLHD